MKGRELNDFQAQLDRYIPRPNKELCDRARLVCAQHATDADDVRRLLQILGLLK